MCRVCLPNDGLWLEYKRVVLFECRRRCRMYFGGTSNFHCLVYRLFHNASIALDLESSSRELIEKVFILYVWPLMRAVIVFWVKVSIRFAKNRRCPIDRLPQFSLIMVELGIAYSGLVFISPMVFLLMNDLLLLMFYLFVVLCLVIGTFNGNFSPLYGLPNSQGSQNTLQELFYFVPVL